MNRTKSLLLIAVIVIALILGGVLLTQNPSLFDFLRKTELTIRWTTESELDIIGFNLYRSDTPDGEFVKINAELIPPAPDPFIGGEHTFVDKNVIRGQTYYYQLESIDRRGTSTLKGPFAISTNG
ncbi:MAG: hypothetical protein H6666_08325 [Ardenticatenaceae bacterium]|nr:hypothetical protein [Anaerolineales bacterium]MCB8917917.1 hypothetical protein [Ardenticatenaceae bacterium]